MAQGPLDLAALRPHLVEGGDGGPHGGEDRLGLLRRDHRRRAARLGEERLPRERRHRFVGLDQALGLDAPEPPVFGVDRHRRPASCQAVRFADRQGLRHRVLLFVCVPILPCGSGHDIGPQSRAKCRNTVRLPRRVRRTAVGRPFPADPRPDLEVPEPVFTFLVPGDGRGVTCRHLDAVQPPAVVYPQGDPAVAFLGEVVAPDVDPGAVDQARRAPILAAGTARDGIARIARPVARP